MRKLTALVLAVLLLALTACGGKDSTPAPQPSQGPDYITLIRSDLLGENSDLTRAMDEALTFTLDEVTDTAVTVTVTGPDICQELLAWFDTVSDEDYSDEALSRQMLALMEGETQSRQFILELREGNLVYSDDFLNAASCGLRQFYTALTTQLMEEMEASLHE